MLTQLHASLLLQLYYICRRSTCPLCLAPGHGSIHMRHSVGQLHRSFFIPVAMQKTLPGTSVTSGASQGPHTVFFCLCHRHAWRYPVPVPNRTIKDSGPQTCFKQLVSNSWPQQAKRHAMAPAPQIKTFIFYVAGNRPFPGIYSL